MRIIPYRLLYVYKAHAAPRVGSIVRLLELLLPPSMPSSASWEYGSVLLPSHHRFPHSIRPFDRNPTPRHSSPVDYEPCRCLCLGFALQMTYRWPFDLLPFFRRTIYCHGQKSVTSQDDVVLTCAPEYPHLAVLASFLYRTVHLHAPDLLLYCCHNHTSAGHPLTP